MIAVGLTGEVGAGKSTVARWFRDHGAVTVSADGLVKEFWAETWLQDLARDRWGSCVFSGQAIDYRAVASIVFSDPQEYRWLCDIVHPAVRARIEQSLPSRGLVIAEIPMLFESHGGYPWMDGVIFVTAPAELRARRNAQRGLDSAELLRREQFFLSREERMGCSDWILDNGGDSLTLERSLAPILEDLGRLDDLAVLVWPDEPSILDRLKKLQEKKVLLLLEREGPAVFSALIRKSALADLKKDLSGGFAVEEVRRCTIRRRRELLSRLKF